MSEPDTVELPPEPDETGGPNPPADPSNTPVMELVDALDDDDDVFTLLQAPPDPADADDGPR